MNNHEPDQASASVKAMPRNIVVRTMPAASGCRAIARWPCPRRRSRCRCRVRCRQAVAKPAPMAALAAFWSSALRALGNQAGDCFHGGVFLL